jgi:hypothetical protein
MTNTKMPAAPPAGPPPSANATSIAGARRQSELRILIARKQLAERQASISVIGVSGTADHAQIAMAKQALEALAAGIEKLEALEGRELTERYAPGVA